MSARPFTAIFPKPPETGDVVLIRGKLKENAKQFSVNFCLARPPGVTPEQTPPYIAYHFKTVYQEDGKTVVVQNWRNLQWQNQVVDSNVWHTDRTKKFTLFFKLHEDYIQVFERAIDHTADYRYEMELPTDQIALLELWDDLEYVEEISFQYAE